MLKKTLSAVSDKLRVHQYQIKWDGVSFVGFKSLKIKDIYIESENFKHDIHIDSLALSIRIMPLIFKNIRIKKLACREISINYQTKDHDHNLANPVQHNPSGVFSRLTGMDLADQTNRYIRRFFKYVPSRTDIRLFEISIVYAGKSTRINLTNLLVLHGEVTGMLSLSGKAQQHNYR